jgi:prepilin-type processing-associated H-X9-DG protein/prepilin-type N-terminal cleavage/methylation domain-containing protein
MNQAPLGGASPNGGSPGRWAFTLVELLVVIAILGMLAGLLLPALSRTRQKAGQIKCLSNLRQLSLGMLMFVDENGGAFPGPASRNAYGFHKEDWIYWRQAAGFPPVQQSPITAGLGSINTNMFRCPLDWDNSARIASYGSPGENPGPYLYSYTLTSFGLEEEFNPGLSSIIDDSGQAHPFQLSSVRGPGHKIMLLEEQVSHSPAESWEPDNANAPLVNDGRFEVGGDDVTIRHNRKGNVIFVDGHAEPVLPQYWQARDEEGHFLHLDATRTP